MILNSATNQKHQLCSKLLGNKGLFVQNLRPHLSSSMILCLWAWNLKFQNYSLTRWQIGAVSQATRLSVSFQEK